MIKAKNIYELLNEDVEDFIDYAVKELEVVTSKVKDGVISSSEEHYNSYEDFLKELYKVISQTDSINNKVILKILLETYVQAYKPSTRYFIKILSIYNNVLKLNTKQYGVNIKKINVNTFKEFQTINDIKKHLIDSLEEVKEKKKNKSIKNKKTDYFYSDKNFEAYLIEDYKTMNLKFGGISDWCVSKNEENWLNYIKKGLMIVFKNLIEDIPNKERYILATLKYRDETFVDVFSLDNVSSDYYNEIGLIENNVIKSLLINYNVNNVSDVKEIVYKDDFYSNNIFSNALNHLVGNKVVADDFVSIEPDGNVIFDEFDWDDGEVPNDLGDYGDELTMMSDAEFHNGLSIHNIRLEYSSFPDIGFVKGSLSISNFSGETSVEDNKLSNIKISNDEYFLSDISFNSTVSLIDIDLEGSFNLYFDKDFYSSFFSHAYGTKLSFLESNTPILISAESENLIFKSINKNGTLSFDNRKESFIENLSIEGFEKVYITISDDLDIGGILNFDEVKEVHFNIIGDYDIGEGLNFDEVKEVHFNITGDYDIGELKNMIADETITFEDDGTKVFYSNDK